MPIQYIFDQLLIFVNLYYNAKNQFIPAVHSSNTVNFREFDLYLLIQQLVVLSQINKKFNYSGTPAFKRQRVGYQSNQKLLRHHQHLNNHLNSYNHS